MQHIKYIAFFLLTACGSDFSANGASEPEMAGTAGIENNSTAGKNSAGAAGLAGIENTGGLNNAGMVGMVGMAGNIAGSSGSENIGGSSGMNSAGQSGNNTGGSSGGNSCIPITCDDYSFSHGQTKDPNVFKKSCGFIDDGCGHKIQCGGCPDFTKCGDGDYVYIPSTNSSDFITHFAKNDVDLNTCNGNCEFAFSPSKGYDHCKNISGFDTSVYSIMLYCFNSSTASIPSAHCKNPEINSWPVDVENNTEMTQVWCCDSGKL